MKTLDSYPNMLPPGYVNRALARIMPDARKLRNDAEVRIWFDQKCKWEEKIRNEPLRFFEPNPGGQQEFLEFYDPAIQGEYFFAGNKTGKTTAAIVKGLERAVGRALWGLPRRAALKFKAPSVGAIFTEDFDSHELDVLPRFLTWCPKVELAGDAVEYMNNRPALVRFKNGTVIHTRTYEQGYERVEGKDYDWVICNEPPPRDIYTAIWRGFTATAGIMWIAATLLSQTWLYDEQAQPFIKFFEADMYQNRWLSIQARKNFEAMLDESEKQVRIYGKPSNLSGKVYPNFAGHAPHVVSVSVPPWDVLQEKPWPAVLIVDPHERKGLYCLWVYVTPTNELLVFDWRILPPGPESEQFRQLNEIELSHPNQTSLCIMDPNRGKAIQMGGRSWGEAFEEHDFSILWPDDSIDYGLSMVREHLHGDRPRLRFVDNCLGAGGPVWQLERYVWDDWKRGAYGERAVKEKPKSVNSDFPDCIRYLCVSRLDYGLLIGRSGATLGINGRTERFRNPYLPAPGGAARAARMRDIWSDDA